MSFLYPAFLVGAVAIALPIVLHLLRRDVAPEVPFSSVRLLKRSPVERTRRRRLRDLLLLAARVAALLLLAAAFARPYATTAAATDQGVLLVAVDRSYSMTAPGRFARALDLARAAVDGAKPMARIGVIAFDERADIVAAPGSAADARTALTGLRAGFAGTRYGPVFARATEAAGEAGGTLVLITDLQRAGWEDEQPAIMPSDLELQVLDAGAATPNVAITAVRKTTDQVVVSVANVGSEPFAGDVRLTAGAPGGPPAAAAAFVADASATVDVAIPYRGSASGWVAAAIDDRSGYAADNMRYAVLEAASRPRVLIVTGDGTGRSGLYVSRALEAAQEDDAGFDPHIVAGSRLSAMASGELAQHAAIVLLSTRGVDRRARETVSGFVRSGGGLLVAAAPDVEAPVLSMLLDWRPALAMVEHDSDPGRLSVTDPRHPIFKPFGALAANLGQVRFDRAWRMPATAGDVMARFTDGSAALIERREGHGRVILFASDLDKRSNDFPLHPAFVPFAIEAVRHASGTRDAGRDYVVGQAPPGAGPDPGVYTAVPGARRVSVNVDPRESGTARVTLEEFTRMVQRVEQVPAAAASARAREVEARQSLWRYGLILMLGVLVVESFVGRT
ncbi:MAG: BatA domain-containing protein [Acidobacteria bacterium]|nr:BatA domain-containing protein [Acidobacteriota bacterium]MCA1651005.1 BatA domain-containing protein [Acidobacteriota bacterium]